MTIEAVPPERVGPVRIGMMVGQAEEAMRRDGAEIVGEADGLQRGTAAYADWLSLHAHPGPGDRVEAVEVFRGIGPARVQYDGIDLFGSPAAEVMRLLGERRSLEEEEGGCSVTAPELLLALWRPFVADSPEDAEGYFFQSALVARPGYYG